MNVGRRQIVAAVLLVLGGSVGGAYARGIVGTPAVESVENRFTGISTNTTTVETDIFGTKTEYPMGTEDGGSDVSTATPTDDGIVDR